MLQPRPGEAAETALPPQVARDVFRGFPPGFFCDVTMGPMVIGYMEVTLW
jgi:hypothetical protein